MKKIILLWAFLLGASLLAQTSWAHSKHHQGTRRHLPARPSFSWYFATPAPYFYDPYPFYRYRYDYYPPAVITIPSTPPTYIQQTPPARQAYPAGFWYYCHAPEGYYPYIKECPSGWQPVSPTPEQ